MARHTRTLPVVVVTGSSIVVACGGGNNTCSFYGSTGSYAVCNSDNADPAGVYEGTFTDPTTQKETPVVAIIAESGDGRVGGTDGTYYIINVGTDGSSLSGSFSAYAQGTLLFNGGQTDTGSVSGSVAQSGLSISLSDQGHHSENGVLNFDQVYDTSSSLPALAGTWSYSSTSAFSLRLTIQADGTFSGTDSSNCNYSGSFGLIDRNFNAYSENYTRSCNGTADTFSGLSSYIPAAGSGANATPAKIRLLADDGGGSVLVGDFAAPAT